MKHQRSHVRFPKIHYPVYLSKHSMSRLKQRAGLNTKQKRESFLKAAAKNSLTLSEIPKDVAEFTSFAHYMRKLQYKIRERDSSCRAYLYKEFFLIISFDGIVVTVLNVEGYPGIYEEIVNYLLSED